MIGRLTVEAVNLDERQAVLTNGDVVPITTMFDAWGDETDDPEQCTSFACGRGDQWFACAFKYYVRNVTRH